MTPSEVHKFLCNGGVDANVTKILFEQNVVGKAIYIYFFLFPNIRSES